MWTYVQYGAWALVFGLALFAVFKMCWNRFGGKMITVQAKVVDKNVIQGASKYPGNGKNQRYVVVFEYSGKKKGLYVSPLSFDGYHVGEQGKLTYRGNRVMNFK